MRIGDNRIIFIGHKLTRIRIAEQRISLISGILSALRLATVGSRRRRLYWSALRAEPTVAGRREKQIIQICTNLTKKIFERFESI